MDRKPTYEELEQRVKELEQTEFERKKAEEALRESEEKYHNSYNFLRLMCDNVSDLIWAKDLEGSFLFVNQAMCDKLIMCDNPDKALGKTDMFFAEQERNTGYEHTFGETCVDSDAIIKEKRDPGRFLEDGLVRNKYLVLDVHKAPFLNEDGEMIGTIGCGRDVTKEKETEEELRDSEEKYRSLTDDVLDSSAVGIFILDSDFQVVWVNQAMERYFGLPRDEIVGKDKRHFIRERIADTLQDPKNFAEKVFATYDNNTYIENFECHVLSDGEREERWLEHWSQPIRAGLYVGGRVEHYTDITERKQAEEKNRKFNKIIETTSQSIIITNIKGTVLYVNPSYYAFSGFVEDEVIGKSMFRFAHKKGAIKLAKEVVPALIKKRHWQGDMTVVKKDKQIVSVDLICSLLSDEKNKPEFFVAIFSDITERKRTEEALRIERDNLRNIFESMEDGIYILNQQYDIQYVNPVLIKIFGPYEGIKCYRYFQDRDEVCPWCKNQDVWAGKTVRWEWYSFKNERTYDLIDTPMTLPDGSIGKLEIFRDITEQKQADEALRKSEEHYRSIFEDSRDAVYITTRDGKFIDANQSALDLFGYSREEMASLNALQLYVHPGDAGKFEKEIGEKGFLRDYEVMFRKKDGTEMDCLLNTTLRRANDGSILAYQGIIRDMTEHKKLEAQLLQAQKMEAIGTLAGGIAHDFNNILGAIIGYTEIASLQVPEGDKVKESLKEVLKAGRRATDLVKQILAFGRKGEQERIPVQISLIIKEALKLIRSSLPTTIEIRQNIESDTGIVEADPTQIHQILMNLCANAGHAMREEEGVLEVGIRDVEVGSWDSELGYLDMTPGPYLLLTVSDTGEGMTPEVLGRIFDPYFTTKEKGVGTGLGLAVVDGIVKIHGGTIRAYSEPGKGTTFHVYLPRIKEAKEMAEDESRPGVIPTGHERILLIDDEPVLVDIGKQILERLGYDVTTRTSSIEALELFRTKPDQFDLVITDMTMPNMTGDKLARETMKIRSDIPIILCTGFSERISEERAKGMGIKAFVMKPLVMRDLANTVRKVLDNN